MARTITDIKHTMTSAFMADSSVRSLYGLNETDSFEQRFSPLSIESILFYIMAACCYVVEQLFDHHRRDVESIVSGAIVASVPWYHKMALAYQHGDALMLDPQTMSYRYADTSESRRIIRYASVQDCDTYLRILVSKETGGRPVPLEPEELEAFEHYMNRIKIAGIMLHVSSLKADTLSLRANISVDPLIIDRQGRRIGAESESYPVREAIDTYLKGILYGGEFNKTRLVDAIQSVEGVTDVELLECHATAADGTHTPINSQNHRAASGCFVSANLENTISYVV